MQRAQIRLLLLAALMCAPIILALAQESFAQSPSRFPTEDDLKGIQTFCAGGRVYRFEGDVSGGLQRWRKSLGAGIDGKAAYQNLGAIIDKIPVGANDSQLFNTYVGCIKDMVKEFLNAPVVYENAEFKIVLDNPYSVAPGRQSRAISIETIADNMIVEDLKIDAFGDLQVEAGVDRCNGKASGGEWPLYVPHITYTKKRVGQVALVDPSILITSPGSVVSEVTRLLQLPNTCLQWQDATLWLHLSFRNHQGTAIARYYRVFADAEAGGKRANPYLKSASATQEEFEKTKAGLAYDFLAQRSVISGPGDIERLATKMVSSSR